MKILRGNQYGKYRLCTHDVKRYNTEGETHTHTHTHITKTHSRLQWRRIRRRLETSCDLCQLAPEITTNSLEECLSLQSRGLNIGIALGVFYRRLCVSLKSLMYTQYTSVVRMAEQPSRAIQSVIRVGSRKFKSGVECGFYLGRVIKDLVYITSLESRRLQVNE